MTAPLVIAIDGPTAAGKGTLARGLAERLGLRHLDSGMLYRATAARLLAAGGDPGDAAAAAACARDLDAGDLDRDNLRQEVVGKAASQVAAYPDVRQALLAFQRVFAAELPGAVIDGRDIGTVVCSDATVKFFVTADQLSRVERRYLELKQRDASVDRDQVAADLAARDRQDTERATAPLRQAEDAILLDTSQMDADQALEAALTLVDQQLNP
ncbi:MAG: (d)CMP kinase [Pseudomonadota bacterium]